MAYEIYVKGNTGAWNLEATAETKEEITQKYADIIQFININKILLTETLPYTVTYDSETREYSASYPPVQP
jgi:hypothetical protein